MCTSIVIQQKQQLFFGRTMDFSYDIEPQLYVMPKNGLWGNQLDGRQLQDRFSFLATGQQEGTILAFFDGVNEKGFGAAALYFAGYAQYESLGRAGNRTPVASVDFLHYILGRCSSLQDLEELLPQTAIIGLPDPVTGTAAPLHWIAVDKSGRCGVVERTAQGTRFYENPIGTLANSPDFPWHMTNLRNYAGLSTEQPASAQWGKVTLTPFGQGAGSMLLPGGFTSPERFVRASFLKTHTVIPQTTEGTLMTCFSILENVSVPKGGVITDRGTPDYTQYVIFYDLNTCQCYFKTAQNHQIAAASLWQNMGPGTQPVLLGPLARPFLFETIQRA